jgi:hypothetical protein
MIEGWAFRRPFAEFLSRAMASSGPVIAIADPQHVTPTIGMAQEECTHQERQARARQLMDAAGVIVVLAGRTGGVRWEIEQLVRTGQLEKTVLLLPMQAKDGREQAWQTLREAFLANGRAELPEHIDDHIVAVLPATGSAPMGLAVRRPHAARSYELAVRGSFILLGHKVDRSDAVPIQPQRSRRLPKRAIAVGVALLSAGVALVLVGLAPAFTRATQLDRAIQIDILNRMALSNSGVPATVQVSCPQQAPLAVGDQFPCPVREISGGRTYRAFAIVQVDPSRGVTWSVAPWTTFGVDGASNRGVGALVLNVYAGSPAAAAGIRRGDVILAIDDLRVSSIAVMTGALALLRPGDRVTLTVRRGRQQFVARVTLLRNL